MHDWLTQTAYAQMGHIALIAGEQRWTYLELEQRVSILAASLAGAGLRQGDRIAALLPNRPESVMLIHACVRLGAILSPLNTRLTRDELTYQMGLLRPAALLCSRETQAQAAAVAADVPLFSFDKPTSFAARALDDFIDDEAFEIVSWVYDAEPGHIVFTSGTSGRPKGAFITLANHYASAIASAWRIGTLPNDRWLLTLPLYHVGGLAIVLRCALYGTTVVLQNGFSPDELLKTMHAHQVTLLSLVPTMLYRLIEGRSVSPFPPSLRLILLGGAAASAELLARCAELNLPVATTYGLTEAASQVATMLPDEVRRKPGSVGRPLIGVHVGLDKPRTDEIPGKLVGEIVIAGPTVMRGYIDRPDDPALRNGVLYTGDLGYFDSDGDLCIVQRRSDLIVSGGENIYPAEVEAVLRQHPAVAEAVVVGLPDSEWGQRVAAAVVLRPGEQTSHEAISAFVRERLAGYKQPRLIRFFDEFPLTGSGKINRAGIAEQLTQR